jgi:hypothetical protein
LALAAVFGTVYFVLAGLQLIHPHLPDNEH